MKHRDVFIDHMGRRFFVVRNYVRKDGHSSNFIWRGKNVWACECGSWNGLLDEADPLKMHVDPVRSPLQFESFTQHLVRDTTGLNNLPYPEFYLMA